MYTSTCTMFALPVFLLVILAVTDASEDNDFSCDRYRHVRLRFKACMTSRNITDIDDMLETMLDDGIITGNEFLAKLTEICSDTAITEGVAFCMDRIITECPELQNIVHDVIENKIAFFCENNQPSSAIRDALQNGFKFRGACTPDGDDAVREVLLRCWGQAYEEIEGTNISDLPINDAMSVYGRLVRTWIDCTVQGSREELETELECGSTRKDILLKCWLFLSGEGYLTPTAQWSELDKLTND